MEKLLDTVKTGLGKALDGAEKYSKIAVEKTSGLINQTKYSYAINEAENKMVSLFAELGEYLYNECREGDNLPDEVLSKCKEITSLKEEIASLKDKIAELKDAVVCSECGEYVSSKNSFCSKCGSKLN